MASYTNLASLAGLQVGDVVTYNTATTIDFKKYKVRIKLNGLSGSSSYSSLKGGVTQFDIDTKNLPSQIFTYTPLYGTSLCYGSSADMYYRIGVAGNVGNYYTPSANGGGTTGARGGNASGSLGNIDVSATGGYGGSQTAGGSGGTWGGTSYGTHSNGIVGSFGRHSNTSISSGIDLYDYFMAGWYSGGTGGSNYYRDPYVSGSASAYGGNGGGSGFVIGQSTTTYPSGYLGDNTTLQSTIASAISNATLTQGASTAIYTNVSSLPNTANMTITILEVPISFPKYYNGSAWIDTEWKYYDNGSWHDVEVKRYNGSSWK